MQDGLHILIVCYAGDDQDTLQGKIAEAVTGFVCLDHFGDPCFPLFRCRCIGLALLGVQISERSYLRQVDSMGIPVGGVLDHVVHVIRLKEHLPTHDELDERQDETEEREVSRQMFGNRRDIIKDIADLYAALCRFVTRQDAVDDKQNVNTRTGLKEGHDAFAPFTIRQAHKRRLMDIIVHMRHNLPRHVLLQRCIGECVGLIGCIVDHKADVITDFRDGIVHNDIE